MSYLINLNAEEEVQLSNIQQFLKGSKTSAIRWALTQVNEKILPSLLLSNNVNMQPAAAVPSAPAAPPAWVCPSPEEIRRLEPYQALTLIMEHWDEMDNECQQAAADTQEVTYEQAEELAHCND